jgi:DNA-directed RNA polymerase subunit M/transcription elongation factor TFIIS
MGYIDRLLKYILKKPKEVPKEAGDEKNCPFCWGYQQYDKEIRLMSNDKQLDVKNHRDKYVKVGKFMVEHVDGFKNKKRIIERCPECGGKRIKYIKNP